MDSRAIRAGHIVTALLAPLLFLVAVAEARYISNLSSGSDSALYFYFLNGCRNRRCSCPSEEQTWWTGNGIHILHEDDVDSFAFSKKKQDTANITANSTVSIFEPLGTKKIGDRFIEWPTPRIESTRNRKPWIEHKKKSRNTGIPSSAAVERLLSRC